MQNAPTDFSTRSPQAVTFAEKLTEKLIVTRSQMCPNGARGSPFSPPTLRPRLDRRAGGGRPLPQLRTRVILTTQYAIQKKCIYTLLRRF